MPFLLAGRSSGGGSPRREKATYKGTCAMCHAQGGNAGPSDADVSAAIDYMLAAAK